MKHLTSICAFVLVFGCYSLSAQINITTVMDPQIGNSSIAAITVNAFGETILVSGKKIFTFTNQVTEVFQCTICPSIKDVAILGDAMYLSNTSGIVRRSGKVMEYVDTFNVTRLISDASGHLYGIVPQYGIVIWDGGSWSSYSMGNSNIPSSQIYDLAMEEGGLLWLVSSAGLVSWNGTTFSAKPGPAGLSVAMNHLEIDNEGNIWVAAAFGGVGKYANGSWTTYPETFDSGQAVEGIAIRDGNEIWTSTGGFGLYRYHSGAWEAYPKEALGEPVWQFNFVLYADAQNRVWIQNNLTQLKYLTVGSTAVGEIDRKENQLQVYPNPSSDDVHITSKNASIEFKQIHVFDMYGRVVQHPVIEYTGIHKVNISAWAPGVYQAVAFDESGNSYQGRIIRNSFSPR